MRTPTPSNTMGTSCEVSELKYSGKSMPVAVSAEPNCQLVVSQKLGEPLVVGVGLSEPAASQ